MGIAAMTRQSNLNKVFNYCFRTLGPSASEERMATCYELYAASTALAEKAFSRYIKDRKARSKPHKTS